MCKLQVRYWHGSSVGGIAISYADNQGICACLVSQLLQVRSLIGLGDAIFLPSLPPCPYSEKNKKTKTFAVASVFRNICHSHDLVNPLPHPASEAHALAHWMTQVGILYIMAPAPLTLFFSASVCAWTSLIWTLAYAWDWFPYTGYSNGVKHILTMSERMGTDIP